MPATAPARICKNCDGHPTVAISVGPRRDDGTLPTVTVSCTVCDGTGRLRSAAVARTRVVVRGSR